MPSDDNKREYYRLDVTLSLRIRLRTLGTKTFATGEVFDGWSQNISGGGLCFESFRDLPISQLLAWQVVTDLDGEDLNLLGHLVWKRQSTGGVYQYGMQFIFLNEREHQKILKKINEMQVRLRLRQKWTQHQLAQTNSSL